jgi:hypothetical protein
MKQSHFSIEKAVVGCIFSVLLILVSCRESPEPLMGEHGWFEFTMPDRDTTPTAVDLSFLNEAPAGNSGFISIEDGHFVDGAGQRVRFFGTNVTFSSCFPEKEVAPRIAVRMKRMGYNVVRFHHMDMQAAPGGIWKEDRTGFHEEQLDKLDWFIHQLKLNGIYTNLNLHVSRTYPGVDYDHHHFNFGKSIDQFYPPYIEMQKEYARMLLTHKNPYTGATYLEEPAIAFVEVNNENSLLSNWWLMPELKGEHKQSLEDQWNEWLQTSDKYQVEAGNHPDLFRIISEYEEGASALEKEMLWVFLLETEMSYAEEMTDFLRNDLGCKSLICDTQASYSGVAGVLREATYSDFIDLHAYWEHPSFPGARWSRTDWVIRNTSMVSDKEAGTLERFGQHRVQDMPLTISEYDHPAPNFFCAEMYPMLNSVAAFQDWDGIYHFNFNTPEENSRITGFFSETGHPLKEVFIPVGAALFRMAEVKAGARVVQLTLPEEAVLGQLVEFGDQLRLHRSNMDKVWEKSGATEALVLMHRMEVVLGGEELNLSEPFQTPSGPWTSDTQELIWDHRDSLNAVFTVNAPAAKAAVGYIGGKEIELGEVSITMDTTEHNWGSIAMITLDGEPLHTSKKILLVAAGRAENTNMQWNDDKTTVGENWGESPPIVEGIPALIGFRGMDEFQATALNPAGNPSREVEVVRSNGAQYIGIGAQYETLWYMLTKD